jgi:hypothetical protein
LATLFIVVCFRGAGTPSTCLRHVRVRVRRRSRASARSG